MENHNGPGDVGATRLDRRVVQTAKQQWLRFLPVLLLWTAIGSSAAPIELLSVAGGTGSAKNGGHSDLKSGPRVGVSSSFGRLPLMFEAVGEDGFFCRGTDYHLRLSPTEALLTLRQTQNTKRRAWNAQPGLSRPGLTDLRLENGADQTAELRIALVGADPCAKASGLEALPTKVNYLIGQDRSRWQTQVPTFAKARYRNVYPGVDVVYYGNQRQLEYDFEIAPGADLSQITLRFDGAEKLELDAGGDLVLHIAGGRVRQHRPVVYQVRNGERREISGRYVRLGERGGEVGFAVGTYDSSRPLIIDPVLVYSTFLGGIGLDVGWAIAVDSNGCAYVAGETASTNFTITATSGTNYAGGLRDAFVAKLDASGTNLLFATYIGGNDEDAAFGIALDGGGNIWLAGVTASTNFPVTSNAVATNIHGAPTFGYFPYDAFVAELDPSGSNLAYSTYLGGSQADVANAIAVDGTGGIYVAGATLSADFPTNGTTSTFAGGNDAFVAKLTTASTNLVYSTYLGGSGNDYVFGLGVDSSGSAVVSGPTSSPDFPLVNALQTNYAGGPFDSFVTKLSPDGATQVFSTYLGGQGDDEVSRLALDNSGAIYLTGFTTSTDFPMANALYSTNSGAMDAFALKLDPGGASLIYSTYLGGSSDDQGWSIAVDSGGSAYVVGLTASTDFPVANAFESAPGGLDDVFVTKLDASGTALEYSTYLGGIGNDQGYAVAVDGAGNAYVTGLTVSTNFPVFPATNSLQAAFGGGNGDAFVCKIFPRDAFLRAQLSGAKDVTILWPNGLPGFSLQSTDGLIGTNTNWTIVTNTPAVVGADNAVTFTNVTDNVFFRLHQNQ